MSNTVRNMFKKEIFVLHSLIEANEPISGINLFKKTGLSIKTIRTAIDSLNQFSKEYGFRIISKTRIGYEVEIIDQDQYLNFKERFLRMYHRNMYFSKNQDERVHFIIRRILTNEGNLYLDDLADECYCSRSVINRDMIAVKDIFHYYKLRLINHTNNGLILKGNEWHIRLLLIREHKIFNSFNRSVFTYEEDDFQNIFLSDESTELYEYIRNTILTVLSSEKILLKFGNLAKMINMTILTLSRKRFEDNLYIDQDILSNHRHTNSYKLAEKIFTKIVDKYDFNISEKDLMIYTAYLNCNITFRYQELDQFFTKDILIKIINGFFVYLETYLPIKDNNVSKIKEELVLTLMDYHHNYELGIDYRQEFVENYIRDGLLASDLCIVFYQYLKKSSYPNIDIGDALSFYNIFSNLIVTLGKQVDIKVIVLSRYGKTYSEMICQRLKDIRSIFNVEFLPLEFTEIINFNVNAYDYLITDLKKEQVPKCDIDVLYLFDYRKKDDLIKLIRSLNTPKQLVYNNLFDKDTVKYVSSINNKEQLYEYIIKDILCNSDNAEVFIDQIEQRNAILSPNRKNQFVILKSNEDVLKKDIFKIVILDRPINFDKEAQSIIIIYNIKENRVPELLFINNLISSLLHKDKLEFFDEYKNALPLDLVLR